MALSTGCEPGSGAASAAAASRPAAGRSQVQALGPSVVSLDVHAHGSTVDVLYAAPSAEEGPAELFHTRSLDGGQTWQGASRVDAVSLPPHSAKHSSPPQICGTGPHVVAVWTSKGTGFMGRGPMVSAVSNDGGVTWSRGPEPAPEPDRGGQSHIDMIAHGDVIHLVWLGRRPDTEGRKGLYHTSTRDHGVTWTEPVGVDTNTCECCWNRLALGSDGTAYALYRDIDPRDMAVARSADGSRWERRGVAGAFDWDFDGCPHVGGGLVVADDGDVAALHGVVWTGKSDVSGVYYVRSGDGGSGWNTPLALADLSPEAGVTTHGDIACAPDGTLAIVWDARDGEGHGRVLFSVSADEGESWRTPIELDGEGSALLPRVVSVPGGFRVFWMQEQEAQGETLRTRFLGKAECADGQ